MKLAALTVSAALALGACGGRTEGSSSAPGDSTRDAGMTVTSQTSASAEGGRSRAMRRQTAPVRRSNAASITSVETTCR
jgi:hypothetical protein